jgi:hypothetical protein
MRPLMLCTITGVAESLVAFAKRADVWPFARVRSEMDLQVLQSGERFITSVVLRTEDLVN